MTFPPVSSSALRISLIRRVIRLFLRVEADDREHLTGRRDGSLNELSARLLKARSSSGVSASVAPAPAASPRNLRRLIIRGWVEEMS